MKEYQIDAVYSSSPPYTCSLIAKYVKKKYNIPWIAGFEILGQILFHRLKKMVLSQKQ